MMPSGHRVIAAASITQATVCLPGLQVCLGSADQALVAKNGRYADRPGLRRTESFGDLAMSNEFDPGRT
jgi:hypothetical protein